jgi:hypothetical protein
MAAESNAYTSQAVFCNADEKNDAVIFGELMPACAWHFAGRTENSLVLVL